MAEPADLERRVALAIAAAIVGDDDAEEYAECEDFSEGYISIPELARAAIAECFQWQPIEEGAGQNGPVLAWISKWRLHCAAWFADDQWWMPARENGRMRIPTPTCWLPLPPPPEDEG